MAQIQGHFVMTLSYLSNSYSSEMSLRHMPSSSDAVLLECVHITREKTLVYLQTIWVAGPTLEQTKGTKKYPIFRLFSGNSRRRIRGGFPGEVER